VLLLLLPAGQLMLGQPVMVKPAEAEKNLAWEAQQAAKQSNAAEAELAALGLAPMAGAAAGMWVSDYLHQHCALHLACWKLTCISRMCTPHVRCAPSAPNLVS
jgi:hypothetical protein